MLERFRGRLEGRHIYNEEGSLVTEDAYRALTAWGFNRGHIRELQDLVKIFDGSYTNCVQKVEALRRVYVRGKLSDTEIILPTTTDAFIQKNGGNCEDITYLLAKEISANRVLDRVNTNQKNPTELRIVAGNNRSHFKEGSHVWLGLVNGQTEEKEAMVVLDGSYQEISYLKTNGYKARQSDLPQNVPYKSECALRWSLIDMKEDSIHVERLHDRVLGLSTDKSVSFSIGFATSWNHVHVNIPFIRVGHANGVDAVVVIVNPNSGNINRDFRDNSFSLTPPAEKELQQLLNAARQIQLMPEGSSI